MLRIVHTRGAKAGSVESFGRLPVRIGSAATCDVRLPADGRVSEHHAELRLEDGTIVVVDLGTPSGTYVAGLRVMRQQLRPGDCIVIGGPSGPELRIEPVANAAGGMGNVAAGAQGSGDGRVDLATAQRIVQQAVLEATAREDRAARIVAERVEAATRKARRIHTALKLGVAVALLGALVAAFFVWRSRRAAAVLAADLGVDRAPVPKPSGTVPMQVMTGRQIYEQNRAALYVLGWITERAVGGCCTAFAIADDLLATNAHCVIGCTRRGGKPVVTQNDSGGKVRFDVIATSHHPAYKDGTESADSPDVGLVRVRGKLPRKVTIASDAELYAIGPGDDAFVLGFPGRVMDPISPSATFLQGRVNRMTGYHEEVTTPDRATLVQHDAVTRGGNSGSPVFNQYGHVIAVHAAHIDEETEVQVDGKKTTVVGSSPFRIAMRIDLLRGVPPP